MKKIVGQESTWATMFFTISVVAQDEENRRPRFYHEIQNIVILVIGEEELKTDRQI